MKRHYLGWAAAIVMGSVLVVPAAHAQYFGQNKIQYVTREWKSITSDHFDVYFYPGLDSLAIRVLDLAEKTNDMLSVRMGHRLGRRVPIILYGSHNDFAQTNVTPEMIDGGTGGFTELLRNRVVLPFTGSYEDLRHVVVHELVHAFMFDLLYGGSAAQLIARQSFFSVPLWFAEGMAEYFSLGIESNAEVFLRDGTVEGYLPPLPYSGGYIVYKQGQSAVTYLTSRYGEERLRDILRRIRQMRSFDRAFEKSMGSSVAKFDEQWKSWLRRQYWPTVAKKEAPDAFGRRLTDHQRDQSVLNTSPAISPQGDRVAFFSDRRQYTDVYLMSALDGRVKSRVIRGERNVKFESIPSFRSSITWSPDGRYLALTAKSSGYDVLYIVRAEDGKVEQRYKLPCEALFYPAWSPTSDSIVVVGVRDGRSDLYVLDASSGAVIQLTDDTYDEKEPSWTPDGRSITFSSDRLAPIVLYPERFREDHGKYGIYQVEVSSGEIEQVLNTSGDDRSPAWSPDGKLLAFISDHRGAPNIFVYSAEDSNFTQLTDVLGGVQSLSWSARNDRLVFSAYNRGGFDIFAVREPLAVEGVMARLRRQSPEAVLTVAEARIAPVDTTRAPAPSGALAGGWAADSASVPRVNMSAALASNEPPLTAAGSVDTLRLAADDRDPAASADEDTPPSWSMGSDAHPFPVQPDTARALPVRAPLEDRGGPFAVPDSVLSQPPSRYRPRLSPDYGGAGFYAASGIGVVGSTQFVFSDFLGDHNMYVATDIFSNSLEETNAMVVYNYLRRRWDYGVGLFHFKQYYDSRVTSLGEAFTGPRTFSERNFGALVSTSYPFDRFRRVEFNFTQMFLQREFYERNVFGVYEHVSTDYRSVSSPSVSLVGDNTLFGYYGPVNGQRYNITYGPAFSWFENAVAYQTGTLDHRRYWDLTHGYTFASRVLLGYSGGRNPQSFLVGGFSTIRGYPDFDLMGTKMAIVSHEFRFPFIQTLGVVGPLPLGLFNLRGAVFADVGALWDDNRTWRPSYVVDGKRVLADPREGPGVGVGYGVGIRSASWIGILKLDVAWRTNWAEHSEPRYHFSIGPEF